jgi:hypothetical protein
MTAWLRDHATMAGGEATRVLRSARRLRGLPVTAAAALDGSLSAGAVRAIVANVTDATAELFAEHEGQLIPTLVPLCAGDVAAAMRTWAALAEDALGLGEPAEPISKVSLSSMLDGVWRLDGYLNPLDGEILDTALRLAAGSDDDTEAPRTPAQRRADALVNIAKRFLDDQEQPPARRNRPHVNVIVTRDDLEAGRGGECADGTVETGVVTSIALQRQVAAPEGPTLRQRLAPERKMGLPLPRTTPGSWHRPSSLPRPSWRRPSWS